MLDSIANIFDRSGHEIPQHSKVVGNNLPANYNTLQIALSVFT